MKKVCLLICLFLIIGKLSAQTTITGTVTDQSGETLLLRVLNNGEAFSNRLQQNFSHDIFQH